MACGLGAQPGVGSAGNRVSDFPFGRHAAWQPCPAQPFGADPPPLPQHPAWRLCGLPTICSFCRQNRAFPLFSPLLQFEYEGVLVPPLWVPNSGGFQGSTWWDTAPTTAPQRPWDLLRRLPAAVQPSVSHLTPRTPVPPAVGGHPAHPPSFGTSLLSPPSFPCGPLPSSAWKRWLVSTLHTTSMGLTMLPTFLRIGSRGEEEAGDKAPWLQEECSEQPPTCLTPAQRGLELLLNPEWRFLGMCQGHLAGGHPVPVCVWQGCVCSMPLLPRACEGG